MNYNAAEKVDGVVKDLSVNLTEGGKQENPENKPSKHSRDQL